MDKQLFRELENKVRRYYKKDKLIISLNDKIKLLDRQIDIIEEDLSNCNVTLEPGIKPTSWEEKVQTSGDGSSYAEKEALRLTEFQIKRLTDKKMEKAKLLEQIDKIELDYIYIKDAIEPIEGNYRKLLELYYKSGYNEQKISNILNWTQSRINRIKWRIMEKIADWDQWNKVS